MKKESGWWYLSGKANKKMITNTPNKIYYWKTKWFWIEGKNDSWEFGDPSVDPDRSCKVPCEWGEPSSDILKGIDNSGLDALLAPIWQLSTSDNDSKAVITLANLAAYVLKIDLPLLVIPLSHSLMDGTSLRSSCKRVLDLPGHSPLKKKTLWELLNILKSSLVAFAQKKPVISSQALRGALATNRSSTSISPSTKGITIWDGGVRISTPPPTSRTSNSKAIDVGSNSDDEVPLVFKRTNLHRYASYSSLCLLLLYFVFIVIYLLFTSTSTELTFLLLGPWLLKFCRRLP